MKRIFDIVLSLCLIIVLSPLMLLIAATILIMSGAPVLFRQPRIGKDEKLFLICKFRTMRRHAPSLRPSRSLLSPESFITREGAILRLLSLDELPQLFNVLSGKMSFVGPRPLIREERKIHLLRRANGIYSVRPGITGLAQISGRDMLSDEEKTSLDKQYVCSHSLFQDIQILFKTVSVVALRKDIRH